MSNPADSKLKRLTDALISRASDHGCHGLEDGNCVENHPDDPDSWCNFCLIGKAADVLVRAAPPAAEPAKCEAGCNAYKASCGALFCSYEECRSHERTHLSPPAGEAQE